MFSFFTGGDTADITLLSVILSITTLFSYAATALMMVSRWHIFKKLGHPGWKGIIPFYSDYLLFKTVWETKPFWVMIITSGVYTVLTIIMTVSITVYTAINAYSIDAETLILTTMIFYLIGLVITLAFLAVWVIITVRMSLRLAKMFKKGTGFALGLTFISIVFYPILAFGKAQKV